MCAKEERQKVVMESFKRKVDCIKKKKEEVEKISYDWELGTRPYD